MEITHDNFEEAVNKFTIELILDNGRLDERLEKRQWLSRSELLKGFNQNKLNRLKQLKEFREINNMDDDEIGSTYNNLLCQFGENMKLYKHLSLFIKKYR